ncbi:hypothetical protein PVAP13_6KG071535 [Panicum virgatum]|uniref:Uncharacterized protein n=1 Tax=Panicum virgatum TaxID=38727 RepID=A0A8T0R7H3_PANVG|nr:hypothetical protein PVAP13_6KG071535 [Panicum virgatum]
MSSFSFPLFLILSASLAHSSLLSSASAERPLMPTFSPSSGNGSRPHPPRNASAWLRCPSRRPSPSPLRPLLQQRQSAPPSPSHSGALAWRAGRVLCRRRALAQRAGRVRFRRRALAQTAGQALQWVDGDGGAARAGSATMRGWSRGVVRAQGEKVLRERGVHEEGQRWRVGSAS